MINSSTPQPKITIQAYELPQRIKEWLEKHGCHVVQHDGGGATVHFPEGTRKTLVQPLVTQACYDVALPDGSHCREQDLRGMCKDQSVLAIPDELERG